MDPAIIRFHHFTTKASYCKLQEIFGSYDEQHRFDEIEEPLTGFEITYYEKDEFFNTETYAEISFLKDFLNPGISKLKNRYFENFKEATYDKGLFSQDLLDGFAKCHRNKLIETRNNIRKAMYLNPKTRIVLVERIHELQNLINDFVDNPYPKVKNKIQFNWRRTDVEYFFYLLRINKEIAWIEDADLGNIIDGVFQCKEGDEIKDIKDSRKHLNAFKNDSGRSENKSNERLKALLQNNDFFNH